MNNPKTRNENIVVQELENEILIYDLEINKAFCLNETSAMVWQICDGKRNVAEISQILNRKLNQPITEDVIWLALDGFKKDNLLEESEQFEIDFNGLNRRQVIKKVGLASMVVLPIVASVIAPQATQAASCLGLLEFCAPANSVGNCCMDSFCNDVSKCLPCFRPGRNLRCFTSSGNNCQAIVGYQCCSGNAQEVPFASSGCGSGYGFVAGCVCS